MSGYLSKRWSFWIALFSCIAFLVGNMVGQHGWQAFWKSVWGMGDTVFSGTVAPIALIPDPDRWQGGTNPFTFDDVPEELLVELPLYRAEWGCRREMERDRRVYSVRYLADYESGGEDCGSHFGVDIRAPVGTPVRAIASGIVEAAKRESWGFGNVVTIRHPNVPDPDNPERLTTLYSTYAHLQEIALEEGEYVEKGQEIGTTGMSGLATGPHLQFQIERADTPFHPYWPFDKSEMDGYGLSFMEAIDHGIGKAEAARYGVNPMLYVQQYLYWKPTAVVREETGSDAAGSEPSTWLERMRARRSERQSTRLAHVEERRLARLAVRQATTVQSTTIVASVVPVATMEHQVRQDGEVDRITMLHDGMFDQDWERIILFARDREGNFIQGNVRFDGKIWLESSFGEADFSPDEITADAFDERGRAVIQMLPRGRKTVIPTVHGAFEAIGQPMVYESERALVSRKD